MCVCVCVCVCVSVCLSVCLSVCVCVSVCLSLRFYGRAKRCALSYDVLKNTNQLNLCVCVCVCECVCLCCGVWWPQQKGELLCGWIVVAEHLTPELKKTSQSRLPFHLAAVEATAARDARETEPETRLDIRDERPPPPPGRDKTHLGFNAFRDEPS